MATYRRAKTMKATDAAWLAGILDGEGTVSMARDSSRAKFRQPVIMVTSCTPELLKAAFEMTGVGLISKKKTKRREYHADAFHWAVRGGPQVLAVLRQTLPFMREENKRKRAILLLEFYVGASRRNGRYTPEEERRRLKLEELLLACTSRRRAPV